MNVFGVSEPPLVPVQGYIVIVELIKYSPTIVFFDTVQYSSFLGHQNENDRKEPNNMYTIHKRGNVLSDEKIEEIKLTYRSLRSIEKTAKAVRCNKNTVNKYVRTESQKDKHSRYNNSAVVQLIPETLKQVKKFSSAVEASQVTHIEYSNLVKALNGNQLTAGGFGHMKIIYQTNL